MASRAPGREIPFDSDGATERARLRWRCRRGMRELDVLLLSFFEASFDMLAPPEKDRFRRLLGLPDPELQAYLIAGHASEDPELDRLLARIRASLHP